MAVAEFIRPEIALDHLAPVVAQTDLKRKLAAAMSQYTRYRSDPAVGRPVVCVYGPSGAGKTFAVESLASTLDLPFTAVSAAGLAVVSYKGLTVRDLLIQHWLHYHSDEGVIFLDEIDKLTAGALGMDSELRTNGLKLQAELLRVMESEDLTFDAEAEDIEELAGVKFNSRKLMWVLAGAFVGIESLIARRLANVYYPKEEIWKEALPSDFVSYGLLQELVGRISTWAWVKPLTLIEIMKIVREQEIPRWKRLFAAIDCSITIDDGALARCAEMARREKTGARGAMSFLRRSVEDVFVEAASNNLHQVEVTVSTVLSGRLEHAAVSE